MMKFFSICLMGFFLVSCAKDISDDSYQLSSVGQVNEVGQGVIVDVRTVEIQGSSSGGSLAGGIAGGFVGSTIGKGAGSVLASVGGAIAGAFLGGLGEKELTEQKALQYLVRLTDGNVITVIQGLKNELAIGQKVLILYGKETKLIPDRVPSS